MIDEQFLTSTNRAESLKLVRSHYVEWCKQLCKELEIPEIKDLSMNLSEFIDNKIREEMSLGKKPKFPTSEKYVALVAVVDCINIIDKKLKG